MSTSASKIRPSPLARWIVSEAHDHKTLRTGDLVVLIETPAPDLTNWILRLNDWSLHALTDSAQQYVHLTPETKEVPAK